MRINELIIPLLLSISTTSIAGVKVVGDYMDTTPDQTCKITTKNGGTCSGTMISSKFMISARHCFLNDTIENTSITCNIKGKNYASKIAGIKLSKDIYDSAVIKLKKSMPIKGMKLFNQNNEFIKSSSLNKSRCAVVGYGINNTGKSGTKNGVYLTRINPSSTYFETIHIPAIMQARMDDFKYVYNLMKNTSVTDTLIFKAIKTSVLTGKALTSAYATEIAGNDPKGTERFFTELKEQMADAYQDSLKRNKSATFNYMIKTYHQSPKTKHTSAFLPGDSGGTVACKNSKNEWVLIGIISNIKLENKLEMVEVAPGFRMAKQIRVATEGGAVPIVGSVKYFIKDSIRKLGGSSKTISNALK